MLTVYGSEINGLVTSLTQFINYFMLVEAGLASAAVYALYKPLADKNIEEINGVLSAAKKFYNQSGWIFLSLVIILSITYPLFVHVEILSPLEVRILVMILGMTGVLDFFTLSKYRVLLTAAQKVSVISFASIIHLLLNTLITVILARFRANIIVLKAVALTAIIVRSFILYLYVDKHYSFIRFDANPNTAALNKRWSALYLQILGVIHTGAPVIIATIFTTLKAVSVYSIYNMVIAGLSGLLSIFTSGLSSSFGDVIARGENKVLKQSSEEFETVYYMVITWTYTCAAALIMPFIKIYTSGITDVEYYNPVLGLLFVLNGLLYNIKTPQGMLVISAGMFHETRIQTTIQGLIAVVGGIIFVQFWGLEGILLATCLSNLYRDIEIIYFVPKRITFRPIIPTVKRVLRIFVCILLVLVTYVIIDIPVTGVASWFVHAIVLGICSAIVILGINILFDRKILRDTEIRIKNMIRGLRRKNIGQE